MTNIERAKIIEPKESHSYFLWLLIPVIFLCAGISIQTWRGKLLFTDHPPITSASHTGDPQRECVPPSIHEFPADIFTQEERQSGYVVVHILATGYLCLVLAIVCDQYFVPSLEIIAESLKVPADVAGATFMAIGTSSPELYSAVIGSFVTESDIGIGTIVGSAVFNILGVTSVTGLLLWKTEAHVDWYPVSRDCLVYIFSVATLICIIQDNIVTWFESSLLIVMFFMYIAVMFFNHDIKESCQETVEDLHIWWKKYRRARSTSMRVRRQKSALCSKKTERHSEDSSPSSFPPYSPDLGTPEKPYQYEKGEISDNNVKQYEEVDDSDSDSDEDDDMSPWSVPSESRFQLLLWLVSWPSLLLITTTIPNCRKPNQHLFPHTFISSVIWIGILSYLSSWMVTIIGHTFGLPDSVAGITLLAAGISVPEVIASVIVVKNGMANMAFSNLIGSNIFDILFCLGMPWLIKTLLSSGGKLIVHSSALAYTSATLLSTVVLLFLTLGIAGWKLNWKVGLACLCLYVAFLIVACACELNFFGDMNPPTCSS